MYKYVVSKVVEYGMGDSGLCLYPLKGYRSFSSVPIFFIFFFEALGIFAWFVFETGLVHGPPVRWFCSWSFQGRLFEVLCMAFSSTLAFLLSWLTP